MGVGVHLLLDLYDADPARLRDADGIRAALLEAAQVSGMTPLSAPAVYVFPGGGLTAFLPLAESHLAVHTYPERRFAAADLFTCGPDPEAPERAAEALIAATASQRPHRRRFPRGESP